MSTPQIFGLIGAILGLAYILVAAISYRRFAARVKQNLAHAEAHGQPVVHLNDSMLVEGEMTADRMHKMARICASISRRVFDEDMDFSTESVVRLERSIMRGWCKADQLPETSVQDSFGAYLGEVLVRSTRGRWVTSLVDDEPALIFFVAPNDNTLSVSPFLMVREKFRNIYSFDLSIAFTALDQKLRELGVR